MFKHLMSPAVTIILALITLSPAAHSQNEKQASCTYSGSNWLETRMYMGLSKPGGAAVSKREWDEFVSNNLVVEFPHGFTIIKTTGYWQEMESKATVYENGRQVVILHEAIRENEARINKIAKQYRSRFDQQSVLISSNKTNVRFCDGS